MRLIVLVDDVQRSLRQPTRVGSNSTGPIVVIGVSVSVLALRGELCLCLAKDGEGGRESTKEKRKESIK